MAKIDMVGPSGLQHLMNVHFSSQDLARATEGKPAMLYFIYNNTTGGFAVTVKVSGQTGVSVPNGKKVILVSSVIRVTVG